MARYLVALGVGGGRGAGSRGSTDGPLPPQRRALEGYHHDPHGVITLSFAEGSGDTVVRGSEGDEFLVKPAAPLAPNDAAALQRKQQRYSELWPDWLQSGQSEQAAATRVSAD